MYLTKLLSCKNQPQSQWLRLDLADWEESASSSQKCPLGPKFTTLLHVASPYRLLTANHLGLMECYGGAMCIPIWLQVAVHIESLPEQNACFLGQVVDLWKFSPSRGGNFFPHPKLAPTLPLSGIPSDQISVIHTYNDINSGHITGVAVVHYTTCTVWEKIAFYYRPTPTFFPHPTRELVVHVNPSPIQPHRLGGGI